VMSISAQGVQVQKLIQGNLLLYIFLSWVYLFNVSEFLLSA
jgi:hypothetical protein